MVSSAELQLINDNSQPENDKEASGGDSPKVRLSAGVIHRCPSAAPMCFTVNMSDAALSVYTLHTHCFYHFQIIGNR